jgi:hypothetical protein
MADGDYERRAARDAELKRLERIMREARLSKAERQPSVPSELPSLFHSDFDIISAVENNNRNHQ